MYYSELHCISNYSFLRGASHPHELVAQAHTLGYKAIALTDECSLAGIVKAHMAAESLGIKLIVGSEFVLSKDCKLIVIAPNRIAYSELSGFITLARRRATKGEYEANLEDLRFRLKHCLIIWHTQYQACDYEKSCELAETLSQAFKKRLWIGFTYQLQGGEHLILNDWRNISLQYNIPMAALGSVLMHCKTRKNLLDTLTAIKQNTSLDKLGTQLTSNSESYLKPLEDISQNYPSDLLYQTNYIEEQCHFSLNELRYQYPKELVPENLTPIQHLKSLVSEGQKKRWPQGTPERIQSLIDKELELIQELHYEYYFLTVEDIVRFAQEQNILYQGRGSAANSVICYCLHITEISPDQINVLFERFISKERDEPPDIDVDFEHQRREEVFQYIYSKYSRERAALAAAVVTYRSRSAIRDVGKALGMEQKLIDHLAGSLAWWDRTKELLERIQEAGLKTSKDQMQNFFELVNEILGFPRHLSQHVGGFVITQHKVSDLVPLENASMPDRTVIQWDKTDLEAMGLLKIDVLALGMLSALHKALDYVHTYDRNIHDLASIPKEDPETYQMLSQGDSLGVFQVESRAQMSMLPRLKPRCFYDLVIQIAIVRPGPIQGDMVHPYLRRRDGLEEVHYQNDNVKSVLEPTLGVPIFQEQVIRLAMVAAGFSGGEADELRRAMCNWGKSSKLLTFENKFMEGMLDNGYSDNYAHRLFEQIKGFGGYGFPESHSASFALLCYFSSWLKCHHPAAFYCALLNSQPMGFYSPSQLVQDAKRHGIQVHPVDVNKSDYENTIEKNTTQALNVHSSHDTFNKPGYQWGIRLGFIRIKSLNTDKAKHITLARQERAFTSLQDFAARTQLSHAEIQQLASADAFYDLCGNRYQARWLASALVNTNPTKSHRHKIADNAIENSPIKNNQADSLPFNYHLDLDMPIDSDTLTTKAPNLEKEIISDTQATGLSLRPHPMLLFRQHAPFNRCKKQNELHTVSNGGFVQVAGLVTGRQRPGTAKGTIFLTLEDETGNINVIVWKATQQKYRHVLLQSKLLLIKGRLETQSSVTHIIAGKLIDYSDTLKDFDLKARNFH